MQIHGQYQYRKHTRPSFDVKILSVLPKPGRTCTSSALARVPVELPVEYLLASVSVHLFHAVSRTEYDRGSYLEGEML